MSDPGHPYESGDHAPPPSAPYPPDDDDPPPPYPAPYPPQAGVFPPSLGFSSQSPMYMPPSGGYPYPPLGAYPVYTAPPASTHPYPGAQTGQSTYPHGNHQAEVHHVSESHVARPVKKHRPTVKPADPFDPEADAEILRKAMKGIGTDEEAIIHVLGNRVNAQRLEIAVQFKTLYGEDLIDDLISETSGNFKKLVVSLMTPLPILYARDIREALEGMGTDEAVLIGIFCTKNNNEIRAIRGAYERVYGRKLEADLRSDTSGAFKRVLLSLSAAGRDESMCTDSGAAAQDAQRLLEVRKNQWGTDESTFTMILCQRNYDQLRLIFDEYERLDIEDTIKSEFSGDSEDAFLAIVRSVRNTPYFYAECLHDAISGLGTKNKKLIRIVATRCEVDMGDIKTEYAIKYGETLADAIRGDCSGVYKKLLLSLIGEHKSKKKTSRR